MPFDAAVQEAPPKLSRTGQKAIVDFETRSELSVRDVGAWRYAEHPSTEILCMSYRLPGVKARIWIPGTPFPQELIDFIEEGGTIEAHNAQFERAIWIKILFPRFGIKVPTRWADTLAVCAYRSLPLGLDEVGTVLDLPVKKDKRGKYLLTQLTKPRKLKKAEKKELLAQGYTLDNLPVVYNDDFTLLEELYEYCIQDAESEFSLGETIGSLPPPEQRLWVLDQKINARGVHVDVEAVEAAKAVALMVEEELTKELQDITEGEVETANQRDRILDWLESQGLTMSGLTKDAIEEMLKEPDEAAQDEVGYKVIPQESLPPHVRRVLEIRQELARASTKKLDKIIECLCDDHKLRGLLQYHGSGTGRWAGRLVQPQNFPRGSMLDMKTNMETLIAAIKVRDPNLLRMLFGDPMEAIASALRGMFVASPGNVLHVVDFAAIEARVTMWLAQQQDALDAFAAYDRHEGPDIYCFMASKIYGYEVNKKQHPDERQLGKITILGCGYQMGGSKLKFQAEKDYKVKITEERANELVQIYRGEYPCVKELWYGIEGAAIAAVKYGRPTSYSYVTFERVTDAAGTWLSAILPNGRRLWYFNPQVHQVERFGQMRDQLSYEGRDNKKQGRWNRVVTYGGMLVENMVQAISRDIMAEAMVRVELAGYRVVLTVHDELISDMPKGEKDQKEFEHLVCQVPIWAEGCPIGVEGWSGPRYKKA